MTRIVDIALACGGTVVVDGKGARVEFGSVNGDRLECRTSSSEGLPFDDAVANLELALGRRGVDLVRGGHGG